MARHPNKGMWTMLSIEGQSASEWCILVDLDDDVNYRHAKCSSVSIQKLIIEAEKSGTAVKFDVWVGVLRENDPTDGSVDWLQPFHVEAIGNPTDGTDRFTQTINFLDERDPEGLDCSVSGGRLDWFRSAANSGSQAALKSPGGDLSNAAGGTGKSAAVGDVMVWIELVSGTGTLDIALSCKYTTN